jgi:hypothetical protein
MAIDYFKFSNALVTKATLPFSMRRRIVFGVLTERQSGSSIS